MADQTEVEKLKENVHQLERSVALLKDRTGHLQSELARISDLLTQKVSDLERKIENLSST
ncbi:hypothetical protein [Segetibacter koreensis]|uniref:hypothetical protein n=1 Tax=Segetibacter koreensis TaxID=398037 RepID=UPI00037224FB|nr:hypothetical protein [Segetibacter koreensis]